MDAVNELDILTNDLDKENFKMYVRDCINTHISANKSNYNISIHPKFKDIIDVHLRDVNPID